MAGSDWTFKSARDLRKALRAKKVSALELAQDAAVAGLAMDALLVCTGGGGMVAGCALALDHASPGTLVFSRRRGGGRLNHPEWPAVEAGPDALVLPVPAG